MNTEKTEDVVKPSSEESSKERARQAILFKLGKLSEVAVRRAMIRATRNITDQVRDISKKYETYIADIGFRFHRGKKVIEKSYRDQIKDLERKMRFEIALLKKDHETRVRKAQELLSELCGAKEKLLDTCLEGIREVDRQFCACIKELSIDVLKELQERYTVKTPTITLDVPTEHSLGLLCEYLTKDDQGSERYNMLIVDDANS